MDAEVWRDDALFERRDGHDDLERGARRVAALNRPVLQRLQRIGIESGPRRAIDARGEVVWVVPRPARERQHFARSRIHHNRSAVEAARLESLLCGALQIDVDGQLHAATPVAGISLTRSISRPMLLTDQARAVLAHQQLVVDLLDAGLPDDGAALQPFALDLAFARLADVSEQVRRKGIRGVLPRRHFLDLDIRQLGVETPRQHCRDLRQRRVVDDTIGR